MAEVSIRWGIVGPGEIAEVFAESVTRAKVGAIAAAYGRDATRREAFCARVGGQPCASLDELLARPDVDAVYVATPHAAHREVVERASAAGVAVLCEKPLTTDPVATADLWFDAMERKALLVEGWMYQHHPQIARAVERVAAGAIGRVRRFRAWFGFAAPFDAAHRLWDPALGGGGILDVGGYPVSLLMRFAEGAQVELQDARIERAPSGVDQDATGVFRVAGEDAHPFAGAEAELRVSLVEELRRGVVVEGSAGTLRLEDPFLPGGERLGTRGVLHLDRPDGTRETEVVQSELDCFALQARAFARGAQALPAAVRDPGFSIRLAVLLDRWGKAC